MQKTMYTATNSLARHICVAENQNFDEIWETWVKEYDPPDDIRRGLKETGKQLASIGKEYILRVPEKDYRSMIERTLKPGIDQEEMYGTQEESE